MKTHLDALERARQFAVAILPEPHLLAPLTPAAYVAYVEAEAAKIGQTLGALDADDLEVAGGLDAWRALVVRCVVDLAPTQTPLIKTGLDAYLRAEVESISTLEDLEARIAWLDERHTGALTQEQRQNVATDLANLRRIRLNHFQRSPVAEPLPESSDEAAARADHDHDQAKDDRLTGDR